MAKHDWKLRIATLLLSLGCVAVVQASEREPVPAILVNPLDSAATPEPICGVCTIVSRKDASTVTVTITHAREFQGDVELVVWLDSDERESLWIPAITLEGGDLVEVELEAGEGWSWDDVQFAWTRMHPTI